MIRIIAICFIVLSLQGCATVLTTTAAFEPEYGKIDNVIKAKECSDKTVYLYVQGKRIESASPSKYIVSLPKAVVNKYAVSINTDFRKEDNPYLIQKIGRSVEGKYIHNFKYSREAIQSTDRVDDKYCIQKDIILIKDPNICKSVFHEIKKLPVLENNSTTPRIFTLPPCNCNEGMSIIIVPEGEGNYPLELSGGGTQVLGKPQYFLLLPFSIAIDIITSPLQLLALLIEIGIHLR